MGEIIKNIHALKTTSFAAYVMNALRKSLLYKNFIQSNIFCPNPSAEVLCLKNNGEIFLGHFLPILHPHSTLFFLTIPSIPANVFLFFSLQFHLVHVYFAVISHHKFIQDFVKHWKQGNNSSFLIFPA